MAKKKLVYTHAAEQAVEHVDVTNMGPVVYRSNKCEHQGRHDAVGEHLQYGATHANAVQRGYAHEHIAHVADAGVPDYVLQVLLRHGRHRTVEHVDRAQGDQHRHPPRIRGFRQKEYAHTDDAVSPQFHQHPGVQHGHCVVQPRGRQVTMYGTARGLPRNRSRS